MKISNTVLPAIVASALALAAGASQAGITTFSGQDDGAPTTGPFTNSDAAQTSFLGAATSFGPVHTETFEEQSVGFSTVYSITGATITLNAPDDGPSFSGISNTTNGNLYGFNTTPGDANWLGFTGGSATFDFAKPTNSFGFFTTGIQTVFTSALTVSFNDGASESLSLPINVNGGASYFGFTDSTPVSSITITNISDDAWGIDDVSFNSSVPEPGAWALMCIGVGLFGAAMRRARSRSVTLLV
jgi:hypothetical protein